MQDALLGLYRPYIIRKGDDNMAGKKSREDVDMRDYFRGHEIVKQGDVYVYADNGKSVAETWEGRPCGYCGLANTVEGYDGCIGEVPDTMNACCGHGNAELAYIQYEDGCRVGEEKAMNTFKRMRKGWR